MKKILFLFSLMVIVLPGWSQKVKWLDEMNLKFMTCEWGTPQQNKSIGGNPLTVNNITFSRGIGTHAVSTFLINLKGQATTFKTQVGVDDEATNNASIEFVVMADQKVLWRSGVMKKGEDPKTCQVSLKGKQKLGLAVLSGELIDNDHADWLEAQIMYSVTVPEAVDTRNPTETSYILTPKSSPAPRINGARVFGAHPGNDFLFKVAVTGVRPMTITASGLPEGLSINTSTGVITGITPAKGEYSVKITARNKVGKASRILKIVSGDVLALTPPMGWNSWNCWGLSVNQNRVKSSADVMIQKGLIEHGWTYINIDDGWEAASRTADSVLLPNSKFPDMKALTNYIHSKGLKMGIYSSPGTRTCGGFLASYQNEIQDAKTWADLGIDYLKYDWCSYESVAKDHSLEELQKPYIVMREALNQCNRDIVFSLCQYGMGDVWKWGTKIGGNAWRTTGDINDSWNSMSGIGFSQTQDPECTGPGHWNDPDMLVVGKVGWGPSLHNTHLTPNEQYTHISMWSLLASPLLIGCDMSQLDAFTLNLLCNDEVLDVDQDPLGIKASRVKKSNEIEIWMRPLEDHSYAVGVFYNGKDNNDPASLINWGDNSRRKKTVKVLLSDLNLKGKYQVRDLWRQKDLEVTDRFIEVQVPYHGVSFLKFSTKK